MSTGSRMIWPTAFDWPVRDEVAAAELLRRQAGRRGDAIHLPLEREHRLRRAEPAERAVRRRVGGDRLRADPDVRTEVRAGRVDRAARQHDRRQRAVRAAVDHELDVHRQQPAVGVDRGPVPRPRRDGAWSSPTMSSSRS